MKYKEKLIELLKTVPKIKEDLEEIKWWVWLKEKSWLIYQNLWANKLFMPWHSIVNTTKEDILSMQVIPELEERHLRMYLNEKLSENYYITAWWKFWYIWYYNEKLKEIQLDNTKNFNEQSEDVYEKLFNYLDNR